MRGVPDRRAKGTRSDAVSAPDAELRVKTDAAHEKPTICSGCGYCVDYCAYDVLKLKELPAAQEEVVYVGK